MESGGGAAIGGDEFVDAVAGEWVEEAEFRIVVVAEEGEGVLDLDNPTGGAVLEGAVEAEEGGAGDEGVSGGGESGDGEGEAREIGKRRGEKRRRGGKEEGAEEGADAADAEDVEGAADQVGADHRPDLVRERGPVSVVF